MVRLALLSVLVASQAWAARPWSGGAVAAQHPLGSAAAKEMLDAGGNAVDAIVAGAFTMAVVGPYHSGLGGGGFAVLHLVGGKDGPKDLAFDFRELAPLAATRDMYLVDGKLVPDKATDGLLSVAVPGAVKGYLELHAKYGKLPRAKVLAPAIRAAKEGFLVTPKYRDLALKREACLRADPEAARIFLRDGAAPALGTKIVQADLAATLTALAKSGDAPFYTGKIAQQIVATMKAGGGIVSADDLAKYHTTWRTPLEGSYRGQRIVTMPPPSAGGLALLETFGILEAKGLEGPGSREVDAIHVFIEALRIAYADRSKVMGDPAFVEVPVARLLSKENLTASAAKIDLAKATRSSTFVTPAPGASEVGKKNTTHLSVIDREGNAVALTTTINYYFGSCVVAKGTGVLLNDQMDDFAAQPGVPNTFQLVMGEANAIAPGKIPVSSMTPTLVFQKDRPAEVMMSVGSPGGSTIPTTVMQVISNVLDGELDLPRAVSRGRIHHQWLPDEVWVDPDGLDPATQKALEARGHSFKRLSGWGDAEAVMVDPVTGVRTAASDPRNEGSPAGQD
jgi:gamma-glutamyltranspeptidase/glutathione hydrolase